MKRHAYAIVAILAAIALVGLFLLLVNGKQIAVLQPSGEIAEQQRVLFIVAASLSAVVVIPVFTLLVYFSIRYRKGNKKATYMPEWSENKWLEGLWWGVPIFIIGILGVITYQTSHSLDPYKPLAGDTMDVQVVALRWKWLFIYPEQGVATLNHLPIPLNKPVRFSMTADAPMSAFWIPSLGSQIYAMNGMQSELNLRATKIGQYTGYTTNINGEGYAKMTFKTDVMSTDTFDAWAKNADSSTNSLDMKLYEKLAQPKSETDERTYKLATAKLFESIMNKNGGHGQHMSHGDAE